MATQRGEKDNEEEEQKQVYRLTVSRAHTRLKKRKVNNVLWVTHFLVGDAIFVSNISNETGDENPYARSFKLTKLSWCVCLLEIQMSLNSQ